MSRFKSSFWDVWSRLWRLPPDPFDPEDWLRGQELYRRHPFVDYTDEDPPVTSK